ncbi:MAG TPA: hypothetical protein VFF06_22975 [Polyangia bacterium]|nr:hypothetical protein [Polyangia bacterium]
MGVGDPLEAAFKLAAPIRAGSWHLVGDAIVLESADAQYDVIWRSGAGDVKLAGFAHHFYVPAGTGQAQFNAVAFEADAPGIAAAARAGDSLVLRFTALNAAPGTMAFIPNGDGVKAMGRIPSLTLP